jgi:predicted peroxiredoxin
MRKRLVIKLLAGREDPERLSGAISVASAAIASGVEVSLWLTSESSWFALPGKIDEIQLPHSSDLSELLRLVIANGSVALCTQCATRRGIEERDVIDGISIKGSATFVEEITAEGVQALVY